jgi:hypothetical protein
MVEKITAMDIELLYCDDCPSHAAFLPHVRELLARGGVDASVRQRRVESDGAAQRERFLGSPTLRVNGVDVEPGAGERTDYGLTCRLYPSRGSLQGTPRDEWVLDAVQAAS